MKSSFQDPDPLPIIVILRHIAHWKPSEHEPYQLGPIQTQANERSDTRRVSRCGEMVGRKSDPEYFRLGRMISVSVNAQPAVVYGHELALSMLVHLAESEVHMTIGRLSIVVTALSAMGGCSEAWSRSFVRTDPPAQADGVSVALVERGCDRRNDPDWPAYADVLGLDIQMRVTNAAVASVMFDPSKVRLLADGEARRPHRSDSAETIPAGASKMFTVHFLERDDNLACNVPMALAIEGAAEIGSSPVPLRPVSFLVSNTDI
jgi:hypothetical protein